jgi:hypothetical protein
MVVYSLGRNGIRNFKNTNTKRDTRSAIDQLEDARHFKKTKRYQLDDDDDKKDPELVNTKDQHSSDDKDYVQKQNSFGEDDDDDNNDAPVVLHTKARKHLTSHCMIESED